MSWKGTLFSLVLHAGVIGIAGIYSTGGKTREKTAIVVRERAAPKQEEKKKVEEKKEEPPKPKPKPKPVEEKKAKPVEDAPAPEAPPAPKKAPVDLGLMLGNEAAGDGGEGGGGVAIPVAPSAQDRAEQPAEKPKPKPVPAAPKKVEARAEPECTEAVTKPVPTEKVEIEYTLEAREAGLEGRLVLRVHVAPDGTVDRVELVSGIGPVLDEAAIAAVKQWRFEPATQCGKPVAGVYTLARRFELGD